MWALVDLAKPIVRRRLLLCRTGHPVPAVGYDAQAGPFVGTFQLQGGASVFHLFDGGEAWIVRGVGDGGQKSCVGGAMPHGRGEPAGKASGGPKKK